MSDLNKRKRLSDILFNSDRERLERAWQATEAAADLGPIPAGEYRCLILNGEPSNSRSGTPGYKLTLEMLDGEHAKRRLWHDIWLSDAALKLAKPQLAKLGVTSVEQLDVPLPEGIIIKARVALPRSDDGRESNSVVRFDVVEVRAPEPEPFPPDDGAETADDDGFDWKSGEQGEGGADPMTSRPFDIGFRVVGSKWAKRRAIGHAATFAAYAACDPRVKVEQEAYLSHFVFDRAFRDYLDRNGTEARYDGPCGAPWLWWDVDRADDLGAALRDARRLAGTILERYPEFDDDDLLLFISGAKGAHVGIPTAWRPEPSTAFHATAKEFCLGLAEAAGVVVDGAIYSKTRLFRAPNSRHPKTGLFKRRLSLDELTHLSTEAVKERAREPEPFEIPTGPPSCERAASDWRSAGEATERRAASRKATCEGPARLSAFARAFIRDGELEPGQREVSTFRVAAEVSEVYLRGGIDELLVALLEDAALDSGLTPSETKKAIGDGLRRARCQAGGEHG